MAYTIELLIYDGVAELDLVSPNDVFFASSYLSHQPGARPGGTALDGVTIPVPLTS